MLKSDKGRIELEGTPKILRAELSHLVNHLRDVLAERIGKEDADEFIMDAVKSGLRDIEEIKAEVEGEREAFADFLGMLADIFRGKESEEDGSDK